MVNVVGGGLANAGLHVLQHTSEFANPLQARAKLHQQQRVSLVPRILWHSD